MLQWKSRWRLGVMMMLPFPRAKSEQGIIWSPWSKGPGGPVRVQLELRFPLGVNTCVPGWGADPRKRSQVNCCAASGDPDDAASAGAVPAPVAAAAAKATTAVLSVSACLLLVIDRPRGRDISRMTLAAETVSLSP
jgi:hypothetical protein